MLNILPMLRPARSNPVPGVTGTFMGRDAFRLAASLLKLGGTDTVLLPAYLCREVLKPFEGRCRVVFYEIGPDLSVDPEIIRRRLEDHPSRLVVLINYFGFLQPARRAIHAVCTERGALLLEDCAHSLLTEGSGETGDLVVYSYRKLLPLTDGGGLKASGQPGLDRSCLKPRVLSDVLSLLAMAKGLLASRSNLLSRAGLASRAKASSADPATSPAAKPQRILPMSVFARNGIAHADPRTIVERRRRDYLDWAGLLPGGDDCRPLLPELPPGVCPLGFPLLIGDRDAFRSDCERAGVRLKVFWNLPPAVGPEFETSHHLARNTIHLPVYPESNPRDRGILLDLLSRRGPPASRQASAGEPSRS